MLSATDKFEAVLGFRSPFDPVSMSVRSRIDPVSISVRSRIVLRSFSVRPPLQLRLFSVTEAGGSEGRLESYIYYIIGVSRLEVHFVLLRSERFKLY